MGTKARVLIATTVDGESYVPNDVVDFPAALAKTLKAAAQVDTDKAAVAYCLDELGAKVKTHPVPAVLQPVVGDGGGEALLDGAGQEATADGNSDTATEGAAVSNDPGE